MTDMYNRLTNAGSVQVLGDAAIPVADAPNPVKYQNQSYKTAEEVNLGLGGRFELAAAPNALNSTTDNLPSPNTSLPFMTQRVTIPSSVALFLMVRTAKIAAIDLIDGEPICADIFSEVSLNNGVRWPTAQTGQQIQIAIDNTDPASAHEPRASLTGVRLRP
jgi:hypothetical protein